MTINPITGEIVEDQEAKELYELAEVGINALIDDEFLEVMEQYQIAKARYDEWIARNDDIIKNLLRDNGVKSIKTPYYVFQYIAPHIQTRVDTKKLKEKYPDIYQACKKESLVKESLRITERKE